MPSQDCQADFSKVVPFVGLKNKGNTCYLNSILQILHYCPSFQRELIKLSSSLKKASQGINNSLNVEDKNKESLSLITELESLFSLLDDHQGQLMSADVLSDDEVKVLSAVCPQNFINCLRNLYPSFEPYTQQDAQECFHCILNICNSVVSILNENLKKFDNLPNYANSKSKVVGGRRTIERRSDSGKQNGDQVAVRENASENIAKNCKNSDNSLQLGCFPGLKRKHVKLNEKPFKSGENHNKKADKENQISHTLKTAPTAANEEPVVKKRRLGSNFRIVPHKQPILKNLFKLKNPLSGSKSLSKLGEKLTKISSNELTGFSGNKLSSERPVAHSNIAYLEDKTKSTVMAIDFIKEMFQGKLRTTVRCVECESKIHRDETFQDVSLPVKDVQGHKSYERPDMNLNLSLPKSPETCSLSWALDHFTAIDSLNGDNKYFCNNCKRLSEGEQRIMFKKLPPIFTLHLKRFSTFSLDSSAFSTSVSKITSALEIPSTIKFNQWCTDDCKEKNAEYSLFGIVIHSGMSITGGHYLSYVKYTANKSHDLDIKNNGHLRSYDGQWLEMDDEQVRVLTKEEMSKALTRGDFDLPTKSAYMLFYHRMDS